MVYKSGEIFLPFCHSTRVWQTYGRTDGRTDGPTDGRTDRILITILRLHYMQRSKNLLNLATSHNLTTPLTYRNFTSHLTVTQILEYTPTQRLPIRLTHGLVR